ncbi:MAG: prolyl oligopeptidase family serine peptidase [Candidatus Aminicenantes bacterium]|nr:prolyl oligopeptidase family serine peptidase [Candidatus Aminicenantes bacterium]
MNKKMIFFGLAAALFLAVGAPGQEAKKMTYPVTKTGDQVDDYFGTKVTDPYRWLEDDRSAETEEWVKAQNAVTFGYLEQIPFRESLKKRLMEIYNYPRFSAPFRVGEYYFFSKNDGLQNQSVIYVQKDLDGTPEVFVDPNTLSADGTIRIGLLGPSGCKTKMAISRGEAGSDWGEIRVMDIATKTELPDRLRWVKFSGAAWWKDGFFYSRYDQPAAGEELTAKNEFQKVFYHKLGDPQDKDALVYEDKKNPLLYFSLGVSEDEKYAFLTVSAGTSGTELYWKDLGKADSAFALLVPGFESDSYVLDNVGDQFLVQTNLHAPNTKVVRIGTFIREVALPALGTAGGFGGWRDDKIVFYTFTSYNYPTTIFKYDIASGASEVFRRPEVKFNPEDFEVKQVFYASKDGTRVPMFIVHKKGLAIDGNNPCYLTAYGGFNISMQPYFSPATIALLENGVVFAEACLRGGGEYGETWHKAGMLENKQNVFDDFIAAAEYLIAEKYTSKERIGIEGGSNGGLLVGACLTQRPDLFKVALPAVGVMDMLRFHKFTVGWGWVVEYGSSDNEKDFKNLYKYSPLHNLKPGVSYPATFVTTADHDDRVVPAHSFKFISELQKCQAGDAPVLIRIETRSGHGSSNLTKGIEITADSYSFFLYNTGAKVKY